MEKVFLSSDYNGILLLKELIAFCNERNFVTHDFPVGDLDYIDVVIKVTQAVLDNENSMGILVCGSGLGVSIAANRNPKIRAALCRTPEDARLARRQLDANVICMGSRYTSSFVALQCIEMFFSEPFKKENHQKTLSKLSSLPI